jgi:hypothetical protein
MEPEVTLAALIPMLAMGFLTDGRAQAHQRAVARPADAGEALANPATGWVFRHYDDNIV